MNISSGRVRSPKGIQRCLLPLGDWLLSGDDDGFICIWKRNKKWNPKMPFSNTNVPLAKYKYFLTGSSRVAFLGIIGKDVFVECSKFADDAAFRLWSVSMFVSSIESSEGIRCNFMDSHLQNRIGRANDNRVYSFCGIEYQNKHYIATGGCREIYIWPIIDGNLVDESPDETLQGHYDTVTALTQFRDTLWSGSEDKTIRVWTMTWQCLKVLPGHGSAVISLCVWNEWVASCSDDTLVLVWDAENIIRQSNPSGSVSNFKNSRNTVLDDLFSYDNLDMDMAVGSTSSASEHIMDTIYTLRGHTTPVTALVVWKNLLCSGCQEGSVRIWTRGGKCIKELEGHGCVTAMCVWNDMLWASSTDFSTRCWVEEVWDSIRLLWIGWLKEGEDTCNIAKLPQEILVHIIQFSVEH